MRNGIHGAWSPEFPFSPRRWPFFYGWVVAVVSALASMATVPGQTMGVGVFNEPMMGSLGLSRVQISAAYMVGTLASGFVLPLSGRLIDRHGVRKTITVTCVLFGLALLVIGRVEWIVAGFVATGVPAAPALIAGAALTPCYFLIRFLGQGVLMMASGTMRAKWFNRLRGRVMAGVGVAISLSFSAAPLFFDFLISRFGWQGAWTFLGLCMFFVLAPLCWLFSRDNPEECGLVMDGRAYPESDNGNEELVVHREFTQGEAIRTYSFWVMTLIVAWHGAFATAYLFHIEDVAAHAGLGKKTVLGLLIPSSIVSIVVSITCGWIVDRTRMKYFGTLMAAGSAILGLSLTILASPLGKGLLVLGMGLAGGCFGVVVSNTYPRFFGRVHLGSINGSSTSVMVVGSALGPMFFSLCKYFTGDYQLAYYGGVAFPVLLALAALKADNPQLKLKPVG